MLDIKFIRQNSEKVKKASKDKQVKVDIDRLLKVDEERRKLLQKIEELKAEKNKISKKLKVRSKKLIREAQELKCKIQKLEAEFKTLDQKYQKLMLLVPNLPFSDVPIGRDERDNLVIKKVGKKPKFDFKPKDYLELGEALDIIDCGRASKVSGSRFGYLKGKAVLLEFALIQFAFENLIKEGFIPIIPPVMIKEKPLAGMGYLDRGREEVYKTQDDLYLVGTSEQSIGPMHMNEVFREKDLPRRYLGFSSCFRREAGSYGKDTKGILRVHQFDKVEMFSFCRPEDSKKEHQFLLSREEKLVKALKIPYRVLKICTGDLGDPAAKKFDIECWMPGQKEYRETHSTSNCTDFQARRLNIRFKPTSWRPAFRQKQSQPKGWTPEEESRIQFVHTLNGTIFAIGRMIIAIIENYQKKDGSIRIPDVLKRYVGIESIRVL